MARVRFKSWPRYFNRL